MSKLKKAIPNHPVKVHKDQYLHGEKGTEGCVVIEDVVLKVFVADKTAVDDAHFASIVKSYVARIEYA